MSDVDPSPTPPPPHVYRHRLPTRIWHWVNAVTLLVLLMSGLTIFNAHPRLYWGEYGANFDRAWLVIGSTADEGYLRIGDWRVETTGVLGRWTNAEGVEKTWAFPAGRRSRPATALPTGGAGTCSLPGFCRSR